MPLLVLAAFFIRLVFINNQGFQTDVSTYVAWALALSAHGFASFYSTIGFADYPPGYFYVLAAVGHFWHAAFGAHDPGYTVLRMLVKLPAVFADLGVGVLLYALVRRFAGRKWALGAAALYLFNPATIYISASWGQVDSISGGLALLAIYLLASDDNPSTARIAGAWLAFGYSLLIKPQAAVLLPLLVAFAFVNVQQRRHRIRATAIGIVAATLLALVLSEPFHPGNPFAAIAWLVQQYAYGSNVYPYNSVNAFNLWAFRGSLWLPDNQTIAGIPQYVWGIVLVLAAVVLIVYRYLQQRTAQSLLEASAIATIAFFVLATRMHERYLFNGLLFTIACIPFAKRYVWSALALTLVLFANLQYSLQYLHAVTGSSPGVNTQNLWGIWTHLFALLGMGIFFWLGYTFLGGSETAPVKRPVAVEKVETSSEGARHWYDPREGLTAMRAPLDYVIMGVLGLGNFVLSFIGYWRPDGTSCWTLPRISHCGIFDELYFARAGEEYLQNFRIYENTHPPLSKLLITFSMLLFGGMPKGEGVGGWTFLNGIIGHAASGDNPYGWRFLDVVFGALVVMLLYVFAKRVTGSTIFATITALLLTFDGMHYVQSRIATPEGFVIFFATLAVYAFYRFLISSQVGERQHVTVPSWGVPAGMVVSFLVGLGIATVGRPLFGFDTAATVVVTLYLASGVYLLVRYLLFPRYFGNGRRELSFGEGSYALRDNGATTVYAADGGTIDDRGRVTRGAVSQAKGGALVYDDDPLSITYRRDGSVAYATPQGNVQYADDEIRDGAAPLESGRSSRRWLILFTVALGLLVSTKWYGVMGFGVSFVALILIALQPYLAQLRPALWGNPRGFRLDGALATIVFVSATVYGLVWIPDLARQSPDPGEIHNFNDVVYRQYSMYEYHHNLKATHPYSSQWWEWPIDYVPVAYFYQDRRNNITNNNACCVYEITSLPNPIILWFGLFCVPFVAFLAWKERNKAYALLVITYLMQWLPWILSPRLIFAYHFYVNIPLICLCNAIVLQRVWRWFGRRSDLHWLGGVAVGGYVAAAAAAFVFFFPILSAHPITWNAWHARMWFPTWIIGPG
jgi:Gpi18-like mannosyltransferase